MTTEPDYAAEVREGKRYVLSNEDAFEFFCEDRKLDPESELAYEAWIRASDEETDKYVFPLVRADLAD